MNNPQSAAPLYYFRLHETGQEDPNPAHQTHTYIPTRIYVYARTLSNTTHDQMPLMQAQLEVCVVFETDQKGHYYGLKGLAQLGCCKAKQRLTS